MTARSAVQGDQPLGDRVRQAARNPRPHAVGDETPDRPGNRHAARLGSGRCRLIAERAEEGVQQIGGGVLVLHPVQREGDDVSRPATRRGSCRVPGRSPRRDRGRPARGRRRRGRAPRLATPLGSPRSGARALVPLVEAQDDEVEVARCEEVPVERAAATDALQEPREDGAILADAAPLRELRDVRVRAEHLPCGGERLLGKRGRRKSRHVGLVRRPVRELDTSSPSTGSTSGASRTATRLPLPRRPAQNGRAFASRGEKFSSR